MAALDPWFSYGVILLAALAAYHFVEKPARKALLKNFSRKPVPVAPVIAREA